jgi:hypothetical protein
MDLLTRYRHALAVAMLVALGAPTGQAVDAPADDRAIALSLAEMLRAARTVISANQDLINDPSLGEKGLDPDIVLADAVEIYEERTGVDPLAVPVDTKHGRLLAAQREAIRAVMGQIQATIDSPGVGFKGLIPATFARLVNEEFGARVGSEAEIKVTAPPELVRNRKAVPDPFEAEVIADHLETRDWERGQPFEAETEAKGRSAYRVLVPEYYSASCHGAPEGELDITGYPKEGGELDQLGGVISVTLYH